MIDERMIDAIIQATAHYDLPPLDFAAAMCAYELFLLSSWLWQYSGHSDEAHAAQIMAFCALREASESTNKLILGIGFFQEDI